MSAHRQAVQLVLGGAEPLSRLVPVAARAAGEDGTPLMIALLLTGKHVAASDMAALDTALELAHTTTPGLLVRVYTLSPGGIGAQLVAEDLVVASPLTWALVPDDVQAAHPAGPLLRLVGPDS